MKEILENISIVIPINELTKDDKVFLEKALESIDKNYYSPNSINIVITKELKEYNINDLVKKYNLNVIINKGDTDYSSQINFFAKEKCDTEYFIPLELDDGLSDNALKNYNIYSKAYTNVSLFLPIIVETDNKDNFMKFTDTEPFSKGFYQDGKIGVITNKMLDKLTLLMVTGGMYKTEDFNIINGFKKSLSISFIYEYLLRATFNDQIIFTIPKIGLLHRNNREGSYLDTLNKRGITQEEVTFWYETAKNEYYFTDERKVEYVLS